MSKIPFGYIRLEDFRRIYNLPKRYNAKLVAEEFGADCKQYAFNLKASDYVKAFNKNRKLIQLKGLKIPNAEQFNGYFNLELFIQLRSLFGTRVQFSEAVGILYQRISQWEAGEQTPSGWDMQKIADTLQVPVSMLFCPEKDKRQGQYNAMYALRVMNGEIQRFAPTPQDLLKNNGQRPVATKPERKKQNPIRHAEKQIIPASAIPDSESEASRAIYAEALKGITEADLCAIRAEVIEGLQRCPDCTEQVKSALLAKHAFLTAKQAQMLIGRYSTQLQRHQRSMDLAAEACVSTAGRQSIINANKTKGVAPVINPHRTVKIGPHVYVTLRD